jgi:ABC-2 type transport system permease protein
VPLRGLLKLTWLELKIFLREPLGVIGSLLMPVLLLLGLGKLFSGLPTPGDIPDRGRSFVVEAPVFASIFVLLSAVLSLVTIIAIYREGGILKRLRATPLRPHTILGAQVIVKLLLTAVTMALLVVAGRRYYANVQHLHAVSFTIALLISSASILSMGFLLASVVPTARFAQPVGAAILYPMVGLSGLFIPIAVLPPGLQVIAHLIPLTYSVSLLKGMWLGESWLMHVGDIAALFVATAIFGVLTARVFRWE